MIDVVLLGTGGMLPLPNRWLSALAVRSGGEAILFDCGEGTQIAWRKAGWSFRRLGAICISHTHADHIAGLPGLLHAIANSGRVEPLTIFGPLGLAGVVRGLRTIAPVLPFAVTLRELSGGEQFLLPGKLIGSCERGEHALPVLAYRVDLPRRPAFLPDRARAMGIPVDRWRTLQDGITITWQGQVIESHLVMGPPRAGLAVGYVTDTRPTPALTRFVAGVALLVCEGTYGSDEELDKAKKNQHMTFREAATLARDAGVAVLWITHFSPALEDPGAHAANATATFPAAVIGRDGMETSLTFPGAG